MGTVEFKKVHVAGKLIIVRIFFGEITIPEVMDSFEYFLNTKIYNNKEVVALLTDLTKASIKFKLSEFRNMISFIKHDELLSKLPLGVIVDSPVNTIFPTIASKDIGIKAEPFNIFSDALEWAKSI